MALIGLLGVVGCESPTAVETLRLKDEIGTLHLVPIDSVGATIVVLGMNESGTVLGSISVGGSTKSFRWNSGTFTMLQPPTGTFSARSQNNIGDVAGSVSGVPMIWYAGDAAPSAMFPSDTTLGGISVTVINDRREVLLNNTTGPFAPAVWRGGVYRLVVLIGGVCRGDGLNDQGVVMGSLCADLYKHSRLIDSPFGVTRVNSGKLAGSSCVYGAHGGTDDMLAVSDSNEVIDTGNHWVTAAGCVQFTDIALTALNDRGLLAGTANGRALLLTDKDSIQPDSLLGPQIGAAWQIKKINRLNNARQMWATAVRVADGKTLSVLLTQSKR